MTSTLAAFGPALLALLPLREQVLRERERPAPVRPEAVLARLAKRTSHKNEHKRDKPTILTFACPDGVGHQNDELLRHKPAHVAHRKPEAAPEELEEQRVDVLQVVSEPQLRWSNACLNFHYFDSQSAGRLPTRVCDFHHFDIQNWLPRERES